MNSRPILEKRALGRSGLSVTVLGFGGAPLGDLYARLDDSKAIQTVTRAFDVGVGLFDTAPHGCVANSERRGERGDGLVARSGGEQLELLSK
jgi:D-threo-aldose 1-dehydrogenase